MKSQLIIQSQNITLRPFSLEDQAVLRMFTQQPEITDILPDWKMNEEQLRDFLHFVVGSYDQFNPADVRIMLAVEHNEDQRIIGWCGVFPIDMLDSSDREVAYALSKDYRNRGYITEAVHALTTYLFEHTQLNRIVGIVKPFNVPSRKVLERTGFHYVTRRRLADGAAYDYFERFKDKEQTEQANLLGNESAIRLRRARQEDDTVLAEISKRAFEHAMSIWSKGEEDLDSNLCPPDYASPRFHNYILREWDYYVVELNGCPIGGVSINGLGHKHARLDKIFIDPVSQGLGLGSQVLKLIEAAYPHIEVWKLETSGRQPGNHHFYEKMGYVRTYASIDEYGYEKRLSKTSTQPYLARSPQVGTDELNAEFYQANLEGTRFSSSNLADSRITDCNMNRGKFTNLNMTEVLLADLRLTNSSVEFVAMDGVQFRDTHLGVDKVPMNWEHCDLGGSRFLHCDFRGVRLEQCQVEGMEINGVAIEDLFAAYESLKEER